MTDFLYARPSFLGGVMSVLDLFAVTPMFNSSKTEDDADRRANNADIMALAEDMNKAVSKVLPCHQK